MEGEDHLDDAEEGEDGAAAAVAEAGRHQGECHRHHLQFILKIKNKKIFVLFCCNSCQKMSFADHDGEAGGEAEDGALPGVGEHRVVRAVELLLQGVQVRQALAWTEGVSLKNVTKLGVFCKKSKEKKGP